jgi:hypothetical protein
VNTTNAIFSLWEYYQHADVRARMLEFMGSQSLDTVTAEFITAEGGDPDVQYQPRPTSELWDCLNHGKDVGRSLWDRNSIVVDLDVEYVNFDQPAKPFVEPLACYATQKPVVETIEQWLLKFGIAPLHWISGQGHHFAWKLNLGSEAVRLLTRLGRLTPSLQSRYQRPCLPSGSVVGNCLGSAFSGLGMVMEFVAHEIKRAAQSLTAIPINLTAIETGPVRPADNPQREIIAIDISEYGDPLDSRGIRTPFSVYLKPNQKRFQLGDSLVQAMPWIFPVPLFEMDTPTALSLMRDSKQVMSLAKRASTAIPDFSAPMLELIRQYLASPLASFHESFYKEEHDSPDRWAETYDRTRLNDFPSCVSQSLEQPNDLLLKPAVIQHLTRSLMAYGWSPRHIAGLVRSKYERDYGWGLRWVRYDAASRADFYVRLFAGAVVTGDDSRIDFNCKSTQEKLYCPVADCKHNLVDLQHALLRYGDGE